MAVAERRGRFEEIYEAYSGLILAYAVQRTADHHDAADVVAETFAVVWRRIDDVPPGDEARPWLYGVARKVLANHHRSNRRRRRLNDRVASDLVSRIADAAMPVDGPDRGAIAAAFEALSESDQELLTLVGWEGLDRDEIATILGCRRATVRVRLHRARRRFERELAKAGVKRRANNGHGPGRWATAHPDPEEAR